MAVSALRPVALGYVSSPAEVDIGCWSHWHEALETDATLTGRLLLKVFIDDHTSNGEGLASLIKVLRRRQINVVLVPTVEHLSASRTGTEELIRHLLTLHYGVTVEAAGARSYQLTRADPGYQVPGRG